MTRPFKPTYTTIAQFYAKDAYILEEGASFFDHNGQPYINEDYPKGTIIVEAENGLLLVQRDGHGFAQYWTETPPLKNKDGLFSLFRDHWELVGGDKHLLTAPDAKKISPYVNAILNAKRRRLTTDHRAQV